MAFTENPINKTGIIIPQEKSLVKTFKRIAVAVTKSVSPVVLFVYDSGVERVAEIVEELKNEMTLIEFSDIKPNPPVGVVDEVSKIVREVKWTSFGVSVEVVVWILPRRGQC